MEKYKQYRTLNDNLKEAKNWINNKEKTDSQSGTRYSLHNISFTADYCGQAYAGANNYHGSPKEFNVYMAKAIKRNFCQLTTEAISLMGEDVKKALIACEDEIRGIQEAIELSKTEISDVVAESE